MNKAASVKLSLRKLFIATLAIGPLAILPSPLWAALPSTTPGTSFTVTNGSAPVVTTGANGAGTATFTVSDRSVLVWANGAFNLAAGETWTFAGLSSTGAVLNKVGYNTNGTTAAADIATIAGALNSTGKVFVLANGAINVAGGASIDTAGGLTLSTLRETSDFNFTTQGNLTFTGASDGAVTLGTTTTQVGVTTGGLSVNAGTITMNNVTVAGDLVLNQTGSGTGFSPIVSLTSGGNVTVTTNNGVIGTFTTTATGELWTVANGTTTLNTNGNTSATLVTPLYAIDLSNPANNFSTLAVSAGTGTNGSVIVKDANNITLGASTVGQDLLVTAVGSGTATAIATSGTVAVKGNLTATSTATANAGISIGNNSTVGGILTATTNNSPISFSGLGNISIGVIAASSGNNSGNRNSVSLTTNGVLTIGNTITTTGNGTAGGAISVTGNSIAQTAAISAGNATNWGSVSMNASAGNITTAAISSNQTVTLNASAGSINSGGQAGTITTLASGNASVKTSATGSALLAGANSYAAGSVLQFTGGNISFSNANNLVVGTTNATGNATIVNGGNVQLGTGLGTAGQNIVVTGNLNVTGNAATSTITDSAYSAMNVFGAVNLVTGSGAGTGGAITLNAARANGGLSPTIQFGALSANTNQNAAVSIAETSTINLASINATTLTANSVTGNIVQGNTVVTTVSTAVGVGSTGTITLGNTSNNFTALTVSGGTDATAAAGTALTLAAGATAPANVTLTTGTGVNAALAASTFGNVTVNAGGTISQTGSVTGNSVTLNSTGTLTTSNTLSATTLNLVSPAVITIGGTVAAGSLTINSTATGAGAVVDTGTLSVTGNATINSTGNVTLDGLNDYTGTVTVNTTGDTQITDINNLTIAGTSGGVVTATAGMASAPIASTWNLTLGNLTANSIVATAGNGGGGNSGTITQATGSAIHSETTASFTTTAGNITVANVGNSAGRVQLNTGTSNNTITYAEDGTVKLGNIANGNGTVTITARNGSIIEDTAANNRYTNNGTLSLQAVNGSINIGGVSMVGTGFTTDGSLNSGGGGVIANAPGGSVALFSNTTNLTLSTINANSLALNWTGGGNLTQSNPASVFGTANITGAGNITLTNSSNNFGPVVITSTAASKNISVTENGTLNLRTVTMAASATGNFTATSVNGDIISSGFGGVKAGGTVASPGTGIVTLAATKGNITVGDATTDFPTTGGVVFNGNNVSLTVLGNATLALGANATSSVAQTLTVTSAIGSISNSGNIVVSGNTTFTTGNGNISMNQAGDQFGNLRFSGNQVSIIQANDMKITTGSSAIGASSLASSGNISIVNVGGVASFGSTLSLIATGNVTLPKLIQVGGTLSVNAAGTKDLSALSIVGDLGGKTPVNLGTGAYSAPQP